MRKNFINFASALLMGVVVSVSLVACGDDGGSSSSGGGAVQPGNDDPVVDGQTMSSAEQKQKLESVATQFMGYAKASDFTDIRDLANDLKTLYKDVDGRDIGEWWEQTLDNITEYISGDDYYAEYKRVYSTAQIKGHFTISNGKWIRTDANDLQISVKDSKGRDCVATLTTSGNTKRVFISTENKRGYYHTDSYRNYADIPQNISLVATVGGQQMVKVDITTDINAINEELDLTRDRYNVTVNATVKNYNVNVSRLIYQAQGQAAITTTVKKDNVQLLSVIVEGTTKVSGGNGRYELTDANAQNINVDVLGQLQVKGSLDVIGVINAGNEIKSSDETTAKRAAENMTILMKNIGIFYDGGSQKRAWVEAEAFHKRSGYWNVRPVVCFDDGTKYAFDEYFTESSWKTVIDSANKVIRDFDNLIKSLNSK